MRIVESKKVDLVTKAIIELPQSINITADNEKEFSYHEKVVKLLNIKFYFYDPYSSLQR